MGRTKKWRSVWWLYISPKRRGEVQQRLCNTEIRSTYFSWASKPMDLLLIHQLQLCTNAWNPLLTFSLRKSWAWKSWWCPSTSASKRSARVEAAPTFSSPPTVQIWSTPTVPPSLVWHRTCRPSVCARRGHSERAMIRRAGLTVAIMEGRVTRERQISCEWWDIYC